MRHATSDDRTALTGARHRPPPARQRHDDSVAGAVSSLQRKVGNRATGRILARRTAKRPAVRRRTGLRRDASIERYVRKAAAFLRRNGDAPLKHFALYLGAAVNEELEAAGCPAVKVTISRGSLAAAAEFDAETWQMFANPDHFTRRPEVETLGDLTSDEAGFIAMTVYHEARHAEQRFRVGRMLAGQGKELDPGLNEDVARAATAAPLTAGRASALELAEARDWHAITLGEDATYREAVISLLAPALGAARAARDVNAGNAADLRDSLGRQLRGWAKYGGPGEYIRSHLVSGRSRKASVIVREITRMEQHFKRAEAAWKRLPEQPEPADLKALADALAALYKALYHAYHEQANEHDAHDSGDATFDAFARALAAGGRRP